LVGSIGRLVVAALLSGALLAPVAARAAEPVNAAIVFAVDVSGSVNDERYELQRSGIASIFSDDGIESLVEGGLAVTLMEWSDQATVMVPWMVLRTPDDARRFAHAVNTVQRITGFSTALSTALLAAADQIELCPVPALNKIIDVSGDGPNNGPMSTSIARDQVVARGFRINGLPIVTPQEPDLAQWYAANVVGGPGGFIEIAQGFEDFARAMRRKFQREVAALP
jgi:hypothetical protein